MLLSIVQCSDYRQFSKKKSLDLIQKKINKDMEFIGPVLAPNVSAMRNRGGHASKGQWLFFMDEDCCVQADKVFGLIMKIENRSLPIACIGGRYQLERVNGLQKIYHKIQRQWVLQGLSGKTISGFQLGSHLLGGALLVKKEAFNKVGGFNENIGWGAEERDFVERLQRRGFITGVSFSLAVVHTKNLSLSGFLKRAWYQNFNGGYYGLRKNFSHQHLKYLRTPWSFFLPTFLFFSFGFMALWSGRLIRLILRPPV